ncbi:MAG: hypothetical protein H7A36_06420 [Chlamydiales bacterium]|nr:hypothetical protein [Chlamydiales bacterium]
MAKGLWRSTFIGGFIAWLWMAVSWNVLPWHCSVINNFPNESETVKVISEQVKDSGIYTSPSMCGGAGTMVENTQIFLSVNKNGTAQGGIIPYVISLITYFIGGLIVALIVMQMASNSYGWKLFATAMIGLAVGVLTMLPAWNWWGVPFDYALLMIVDNFLAWLFAGLVIAAFIHPKHRKGDKA